MSKQPEALRLADALETYGPAPWANSAHQAAAELRRLHEENERLKAQQQEPYGQVTVVRRPGCVDQHWFYRWPEPPYLDNAAECHMVYTSPQPAQPAQQQCNPHPKAPHGFDRNSSHSADRYVCDCEGWDAYDAGYETGFSECLKRQEALDRMAENARELGLDYEPIVEQVEDSVGIGHGAWDMVEPKELAKAFHEALAEQPAQGCEFCSHPLYAGTKCKNCGREQPAQQDMPKLGCVNHDCDKCKTQQQEPVAVVKALPMGHNQSDMHYAECQHLPVGTLLYTSPPASKPWVGLTQKDIDIAFDDTQEGGGFDEFARAIEAKLKERNA